MTTALYRRYRPETFSEVIGQEHVTGPLMRALRSGRVNHAYLFSGPRGCGKTTSARILARTLNCARNTPETPIDTPCGQCASCVELARGGPGSLDVVEIDAASHGGVDDARDLRERATFAPTRDRYKIFIIDEAHMVSPAGFNALLKIVEEPPPHIKFVFATTEPDKVIGTIRSRTHHYPFRLVPPDVLGPYLEELCAAEGVTLGGGVVPLVVRAGGGSVRDSLSVLDQLIAGATGGTVDYDLAVGLLGYTHASLLDDVVDALAARDGASIFRVVDQLIVSGHAPQRFVDDLLERLRDLIVIAVSGDAAGAVLRGQPEDQLERMAAQASRLGIAELSRAADLVNTALTEMTGATSPRLHLELLCARLLLPGADAGSAGLAARVERLERGGMSVGARGPAPVRPGAPADDDAAGPGGADPEGLRGAAAVRAAMRPGRPVPGTAQSDAVEGARSDARGGARPTAPAGRDRAPAQAEAPAGVGSPAQADASSSSGSPARASTTVSPGAPAPGPVLAEASESVPPAAAPAAEPTASGQQDWPESGQPERRIAGPSAPPASGRLVSAAPDAAAPAMPDEQTPAMPDVPALAAPGTQAPAAPAVSEPDVPGQARVASGEQTDSHPAAPEASVSAAEPESASSAESATPTDSASVVETALASSGAGDVTTEVVRRRWREVLASIGNPRAEAFLGEHSQVLRLEADVLRLGFPPAVVAQARHGRPETISDAVYQTLGIHVRIEIDVDDGARPRESGLVRGPSSDSPDEEAARAGGQGLGRARDDVTEEEATEGSSAEGRAVASTSRTDALEAVRAHIATASIRSEAASEPAQALALGTEPWPEPTSGTEPRPEPERPTEPPSEPQSALRDAPQSARPTGAQPARPTGAPSARPTGAQPAQVSPPAPAGASEAGPGSQEPGYDEADAAWLAGVPLHEPPDFDEPEPPFDDPVEESLGDAAPGVVTPTATTRPPAQTHSAALAGRAAALGRGAPASSAAAFAPGAASGAAAAAASPATASSPAPASSAAGAAAGSATPSASAFARVAAPAPSARTVVAAPDPYDDSSADDPDIASSGLVGVPLVVKMLDGTIIDEQVDQT
ncbi:DNA polymerase III subunit gamma and tau [Xylanimonas ulmi]|uniref:DNA-directed DNA polymerase n=1 Tax=Xylanimonas ulmi TaxID=228973 RepID=A0A4Q7M4I4_9MICO|nr:DNA polymerase III subunit gamma and tau [Xylanibacterium ulmi]RZS62875.1 DNA polymerase-3 subunit gamma/tau [Xylanibacterium ulmi]